MRCCVAGCKNDSRHISKSQGITFHVFPNEPTLRAAWLQALGKVDWTPKERSAVCSEHFLSEDLYETKSGLRKVKVGAVPFILQDTSTCDYGEPASLKIDGRSLICEKPPGWEPPQRLFLQLNSSINALLCFGLKDIVARVCRVCLVMDCKLFPISVYNLKQAYENLTGVTVSAEEKLPQKICYECAARLINSYKFKTKCLRANSLMLEIVKKQRELTLQNIKTINRENNQLSSPLIQKYQVDHYDKHIDYELSKIEEVKEIKREDNEIYIAEDEEILEIPPVDTEVQIDFITDNLSDNNYSSDDSLPLEKTKKTKKRKIEKKEVEVRKKQIKPDPAEPKIDRRRKPFLNDDLSETLFTVTDLTFEEQVAEIEKRRESANYKNAIFKCTECYKGFLDEDAYNTHMTRHTTQCGEHSCAICALHFKHPHALRKHVTAHHTQRFSCRRCPYVTTHRQTARLHHRWHNGTRYCCPHCQDVFVKFTTYMGHIRIKHPSDFVCELCGYSFVSMKGIELHKKLKHRLEDGQVPEDGPYCELCNVRFVSVEAHRRHLYVSGRHTDTDKEGRDSNRPKQGRKSKESKEIRSRENRDSEDKRDSEEKRKVYPSQLRKAEGPIPCEQCGLQLEDSRAYHGHFRRMHPDKNRTKYPSMKSPCMCEVCGRMFQSFALLKDHRWVHTGERPFKCDSCGKSFRMKQRLVTHRRVHSQIKAAYACSLCGKNFSTQSNRQRHMFIHTGLKPFKCEMCGKGFKHASEKRAHITYVHLKKPWPKRTRGKRRSDSRQGMVQGPSGTEMEAVQPIWPPCDPKMSEMNVIEEKPMYYTLKI